MICVIFSLQIVKCFKCLKAVGMLIIPAPFKATLYAPNQVAEPDCYLWTLKTSMLARVVPYGSAS
jgi:hypothetical protein